MREGEEETESRANEQALQQRRRRRQRLLAAAEAAMRSAGHAPSQGTEVVPSPARLARPRVKQDAHQAAPHAAAVPSPGPASPQRTGTKCAEATGALPMEIICLSEVSGAHSGGSNGADLVLHTGHGRDVGVGVGVGGIEDEGLAAGERQVTPETAPRLTESAPPLLLVTTGQPEKHGNRSSLGHASGNVELPSELSLPRPPPGRAGRRVSSWKGSSNGLSPALSAEGSSSPLWRAREEEAGTCREDGAEKGDELSVERGVSCWIESVGSPSAGAEQMGGSPTLGPSTGGSLGNSLSAQTPCRQGRRIALHQLETLLLDQQVAVQPDEAD